MAKKTEQSAKTAAEATAMGRRQQFIETYRITKRSDPAIGRWLLGTFVVAFAVGFVLFKILPGQGVLEWILAVVGGFLTGSLATMIVFSRRAQKSAYSQMDGQPGAAAAALSMLRRGWRTDPAVAFTRQQDVVHRVVGPPGIVLVGEGGSTARVRPDKRAASTSTATKSAATESPFGQPALATTRPITPIVPRPVRIGRNRRLAPGSVSAPRPAGRSLSKAHCAAARSASSSMSSGG